MAGRQIALWRLIAALTLAVGVMHWAALAWLASQWVAASVLRPLATPLFTRTLAPSAPVMPQKRDAAQPQKARRAPVSVASVAATEAPSESVAAPPQAAPAPPPSVEQPIPSIASTAPEPAVPTPQAPTPPTAAPADTWPANTRLRYVVGGQFRGELHGTAQVQWQRDGERYQVQLEVGIGWLAHLTMTSQGQVRANELRPEAFEEQIGTRRRHVTFTSQEIVLMSGARVPRPEGVQDTASQFVELSHRFANAAVPLAVGQTVQFWLVRPGGVDEWTYDVVELVTLATPRHGPVPAFHLKPRPLAKPRGTITAEMWFAPSLQYLPARIKISLNEQTWVDLLVDKIEQSEATPRP